MMNNSALTTALKTSHPRPKTKTFEALLDVVGEPDMAEVIWIFLEPCLSLTAELITGTSND